MMELKALRPEVGAAYRFIRDYRDPTAIEVVLDPNALCDARIVGENTVVFEDGSRFAATFERRCVHEHIHIGEIVE